MLGNFVTSATTIPEVEPFSQALIAGRVAGERACYRCSQGWMLGCSLVWWLGSLVCFESNNKGENP